MTKIIASDLDGTLLLHGAQSLNPEIFDIILALKEKGIQFISASGRQIASQRKLFAPIADEISYIAENGAVCFHHGNLIAAFEMERDLAFRILDSIDQFDDCKAVVSGIQACYVKSGDDNFFHHVAHVLNNTTEIVDDFREITEPILKIAFWDLSREYAHADYFKTKFNHEVKVITSGSDWVDFMPYGTNKGSALRIMLEKLGIDPKDMIAFGDQENDVEMLTLAGKSYAMEGGVPAAKEVADEITSYVEDTLKTLLTTL